MIPARNNAFVPLIATVPAAIDDHAEFLATVVSLPNEVQQFHSPQASILPNAPARAATCEPKVSLQREGDRVTGIHIQCSCGEVIELACAYPTPVSAPIAPATQPATIPPSAMAAAVDEPEPGKICNDSGKEMPISAKKAPKAAEKARGTSAAKRSTA